MKTNFPGWGIMIFAVFCLGGGACNGSTEAADGAVDRKEDGSGDGGQDGSDGSGQDGADSQGGDHNLEDDFGILIADGLSACSQNYVRPLDLGEVLRAKARISFRPGLIRLSRDQTSIEVDLVEKLEMGQDAEVALAQDTGKFAHRVEGSDSDGYHFYEFSQTFLAGGKTYRLTFDVYFEVKGGQALEPLLVLDAAMLDNRSDYDLLVARGPGLDEKHFTSCGLASGKCQVFEMGMQGGDQLKLETCQYCPMGYICKESLAVIRRALFISGQEQRDLSDHFHLAQSMAHHDWGTSIIIALPNPLGSLCGLHLHASDEFYPDEDSFTELQYLDQNFALLEKKPISQFVIKPAW